MKVAYHNGVLHVIEHGHPLSCHGYHVLDNGDTALCNELATQVRWDWRFGRPNDPTEPSIVWFGTPYCASCARAIDQNELEAAIEALAS